jgi:hypothetical protein
VNRPLRVVLSLLASVGLLAAMPQTTVAKKRHHRRPGCDKFCRQAGGFGAGPGTKVPVKIRRQTIRVDDGLIGVTASCTLEHKCVGAILLVGHDNIEYGRANLRIPEDQTRVVFVPITSRGRRFLNRVHHDHHVFASVPLNSNDPVSFSKRLTLLRNDR